MTGEPLDYRDPRLDAPERRSFMGQLIGGFFAGVIAVFVAGVPWSLANIHFTTTTQPAAWQTNHFEWKGPLGCTGAGLALFAAGLWSARKAGKRGFVLGGLCGAGLMMLIEGICYANNWG